MRSQVPAAPVLPLLLLTALGVSCGGGNEYVEPPPPTVTVSPPLERPVTDYIEITGNTKAVATVEIRARVEGFLQAQHFEEGSFVADGDLLYTIDPSEYDANLQRAVAAVKVGDASVDLTTARLQRLERALKTSAVSEVEVLEERARRREALASRDAARAARTRTELDLSYTQIRSPISGRVGRKEVDVGNLVGASEQTLLTTVVQYDPMYAFFDISEREVLELIAAADEDGQGRARADSASRREIAIELGRATDEGYPYHGLINYSDQGVDPATGTFLIRGSFPNPPPFQLVPGLFVRGRVPVNQRPSALLVSERAIGSDQSGQFLLLVNDDGVVQQRSVTVGALVDGYRVIESGIERGDSVIVNGLVRARPGAVVSPEPEGAVDVAAPPAPDEG